MYILYAYIHTCIHTYVYAYRVSIIFSEVMCKNLVTNSES